MSGKMQASTKGRMSLADTGGLTSGKNLGKVLTSNNFLDCKEQKCTLSQTIRTPSRIQITAG